MLAFLASFALPDWAKKALRVAGVAVVVVLAIWWAIDRYGDRRVEADRAEREAAAQVARDAAAEARATDAAINAVTERSLHDAIQTAPSGTISPAAHALACARLKKAYSPEKLAKMAGYLKTCPR